MKSNDLIPIEAIRKTNTYQNTMKKYRVSVSKSVMQTRKEGSAISKNNEKLGGFDPDEVTDAMNLEAILNSLTFVPRKKKMYSVWKFILSLVSLLQTILYASSVGWGFHHDFFNWRNILLFIIELIYLINIIIQFFIAYDIEGDGVYEYRFEKTAKRFMQS